MPKTVSQLPAAAAADRNAVVAADNAAGTLTEKVTLGQIADLSAYHLSASTTNATPTVLSGDSLTLQNGEAWQFEVKVVAVNRKTSATKVWSIRGGIRRTFGGATALVGTLDTQTTGSIGGGGMAVTAGASGLVITATGLANAGVDWTATVLTSEETTTQQALVGGCTDPDVGNYSASADFDDGSCSYSAVPSSAALEPIAYEGEIESLAVTVGEAVLYPAFDPAIHDYCVSTSAAYLGNVSYSIVINEGDPITGTDKAGRTLQINDGTNYYYVRLLPSDVDIGSVEYGPTESFLPGFYLCGASFSGYSPNGLYYRIYDHRGVPLWYGRSPSTQPVGLRLGRHANRLALNSGQVHPRATVQLNSASISRSLYSVISSSAYGTPSWDQHEMLELSAPQSRAGNIVGVSYSQGFYIQEQSPSGELVWDWHSKDYFVSQDPETYHLNSVDVHPITGNLIVSLRHNSAVLCIDYASKEVLWVLQGSDYSSTTLHAQAIQSATENTKWLTINGEPSFGEYQYAGPAFQHDARWHQDISPLVAGCDVISLFDNQGTQSASYGPRARGVIYEINAAAGTATHMSSIFSEVGTSPFTGSYTIVGSGGTLSHAISFTTEHPALVEYIGDVGGQKTKVFEMDLPANQYQIVKVPPGSFRLDNLRATCGVNIDTGALVAGGGGGGGGSTALLLHFDGSNGSTTFTDSSGNGLAVTANGNAAISTAQSKFGGGSAAFDGGGAYATGTLDSFDDDADFTIEMWVRFNSTVGVQCLMEIGGIANNVGGINLYANSGAITASDGLGWNLGSTAASANEWIHVALVRNSGENTLYINGVSNGVNSSSFACGNSGFTIGSNSYEQHFDGYIDELRVINGTAVYTADFTPPSAPFTP